ncbi:MAG: CoA ester lyase [Burkholderiales bacterium]|nr:CoA ester lyase [Burkholderiales bacterium]
MSMEAVQGARSFLFVPGDRPERLPKALASAAHAVIVDLEDAVAPGDKPRARAALAMACASLPAQQVARLLVRINAADTPWHAEDLALLRELGPHGLAGVVVPKADSASVISAAVEAADAPVLALIESAAGLHAAAAVASAPGVARLAFGHLDFQADIGMQCGEDERELDAARLAIAVASRVAGLPKPVDGVTAAIDDEARLTADVARSRRFGFGAKLCIHPKQLDAVHEGLGPTQAERDWARRVLEAADRNPAGAFRLDGQMVDAPVLLRARSYLA